MKKACEFAGKIVKIKPKKRYLKQSISENERRKDSSVKNGIKITWINLKKGKTRKCIKFIH